MAVPERCVRPSARISVASVQEPAAGERGDGTGDAGRGWLGVPATPGKPPQSWSAPAGGRTAIAPGHMPGRLRNLWDSLVTSLWFIPAVMMAAVVPLWTGAWWIDRHFAAPAGPLPWWVYVARPQDARELTQTLLSSVITMTSLVFSITMVVLTLAASQYGPRLIRSFMSSPMTQSVLGTFTMTILFCLIELAYIGRRAGEAQVAFPSVTGAVVLTAASIVVLVLFIHFLGRSIVSETIIERVGRELDATLDELQPDGAGSSDDPEAALTVDFLDEAERLEAPGSGYVQAIEFSRLVRLAAESDVTIGFLFRPGDYIAEHSHGIGVAPGGRLSEAARAEIASAIILGAHRTPVQDPEFSIRHLVEIGVRALSASVNDPYTALAVLNRLAASLVRLMGKTLPQAVFRDAGGTIRVACPQPTYAGFIDGALNQIRQNGAGMPVIAIHLAEAIGSIAGAARLPSQVQALKRQLDALETAVARLVPDASDRDDIGRRLAAARGEIERAGRRVAPLRG